MKIEIDKESLKAFELPWLQTSLFKYYKLPFKVDEYSDVLREYYADLKDSLKSQSVKMTYCLGFFVLEKATGIDSNNMVFNKTHLIFDKYEDKFVLDSELEKEAV
jgi:hypothetical protein